MGMYTELVLAAKIKPDNKVIQTLNYMLGETEYLPVWENEPLFLTERFHYMLRCDSFYFDGQTDSKLFVDNLYKDKPMYYLNVRCNFKNYDMEINKFLEWLCPYIETDGFLGYERYEEFENPTLIYKYNGKIGFLTVNN